MSSLNLNLWWEPRNPTQADDAHRLARFVTGLPDFDPIYKSWLRSRKAARPMLPVPLSETEAKRALGNSIMRYDDGRDWPEAGSYLRAGHAGPPPYDFGRSSAAATECVVGDYIEADGLMPNHVFMQLSGLRPSTGRPWQASELRPLMKFALEVWNPAEMCAMFSFHTPHLPTIADPKWAGDMRLLRPRIGWITYLPPDLASRARYPADVQVETLDDGAALVTLCEEPFEETDPEGVARLHALEAALRPIQT